jgi:hypothetical protein
MSFIVASATSAQQRFILYLNRLHTHPALPAASRWFVYTTSVRLHSKVQASTVMTSRFPKPCVGCKRLYTGKGDYCNDCRLVREREKENDPRRRAKKAGLYNAQYTRLAKIVRENAQLCHLCGKGWIQGDPWTADHLIAGDTTSPLAPAHRSCNSSRGNKPLNTPPTP